MKWLFILVILFVGCPSPEGGKINTYKVTVRCWNGDQFERQVKSSSGPRIFKYNDHIVINGAGLAIVCPNDSTCIVEQVEE